MNILKADRSLAEKLISTNIMEILMALTKIENKKIVDLANEALKIAEDLKLIQKREEAEASGSVLPAVTELRLDEDDPDMPELD